jgi:phosphoserine phosphatase RsbX
MALTQGAAGPLTWAAADRARGGAVDSGDSFVVVDRERGPLVAVLDGLGHGPEAARAARAGADALRRNCHQPMDALFRHCANALRATRGAVATICSFDHPSGRLTWAAIGNVVGLLLHRNGEAGPRRREVVQIGGILGHARRPPRIETVDLRPLLVLATDGIHPDFLEALDDGGDPGRLAARILSSYAVDDDDALVLVGCYDPAAERVRA